MSQATGLISLTTQAVLLLTLIVTALQTSYPGPLPVPMMPGWHWIEMIMELSIMARNYSAILLLNPAHQILTAF
jgi:hypothetical protein